MIIIILIKIIIIIIKIIIIIIKIIIQRNFNKNKNHDNSNVKK